MFCSFKYCPRRKKLIYRKDGVVLHDSQKYHLECWKQKRAEKINRDDLPSIKSGVIS